MISMHLKSFLVDQEEKKLNMFKLKRVRQTSPINNTVAVTRAGNGPTIQKSALNKATGRAVNSVGAMSEFPVPYKSTNQLKPKIVLIPDRSMASSS